MDDTNHRVFLASCLDPRQRIEVERFGRTRVGRGWRLDGRQVPENYIWFVLAGRGRAGRAGGQGIALAPGSAGWFAPGVAHDLVPDPAGGRFVFYHLRFTAPRPPPHPACLLAQAGHLRTAMAEAYADRGTGSWQELRFRARLVVLLAGLLEAAGGPAGGDGDRGRRERILELVERQLPRPLHPAALLREIGLGHDYGARWFRRVFGQAPRTWLREQRIRRAADELAHDGGTVAEIARRWGYADHRLFSRQFRQTLGATPTAWRDSRC